MSRTYRPRRFARQALGALLASGVALVLFTGCASAESGMMGITVDSDGHPVGLAVSCRDELRTGHLQRWVASPEEDPTVASAGSPAPVYVEEGEIASWALPSTTQEIVAWTLDARGPVNEVTPLTGPPDLNPTDTYRLVGTSASGAAHVVQFTLPELRHIQPGQAIVRDRGGEPRTIDLNQLVDVACTDIGLSPTRSPSSDGVVAQDR